MKSSQRFKAIFSGFKNLIFENKEIEEIAKKRILICSSCPHAKKMKYEIIKDKRIEKASGMCCKLCGCPLSTLLRQGKKSCEAGKW